MFNKVLLWLGVFMGAGWLMDHGVGEPVALGAAAVLGVAGHSILSVRQDRARERRLQVEDRRREARYLRNLGYDAMPPWLIDSPNTRVLRDPAQAAAWEETKRRRALGEMEAGDER
jgi:hypothetical protein